MGEPIPVADGPPSMTQDVVGATIAVARADGRRDPRRVRVVAGLFVWVSRRDEA